MNIKITKEEEAVEKWKAVKNYEGFYEVSDMGRVRSLDRVIKTKRGNNRCRGKILNQSFCNSGYLKVGLSKGGKGETVMVHQQVAISFLNHTPDGFTIVVDHIDEIKTNNRVSNLRLVSNRTNSTGKKKSASKYRGVVKNRNKWMARIVFQGEIEHLGMFENDYEAHLVYQKRLLEIENMNDGYKNK